MSRKVKKKRVAAVQASSEPRFAGLGPLLPIASVVAVIAVSVCGLEWLRAQVLAAPEFNNPPQIKLEHLPGAQWVEQEGWLPRIAAGIRLPDKPLMDDELLPLVAKQLANSGWVRSVQRVVRDMDGTIRACCDYRRPIAMVLTDRGKYIPVDKDGVRLPEEYDNVESDSGWMRILGVRTEPPPVGRSYADFQAESDAVAAVRLAFLLFSQPDIADRINGIDVTNYNGRENKFKTHITLYSRDGRYAEWGSAIGREVEEPDPVDKLRNLVLFLRPNSPQASADLSIYRNGILAPVVP